VTIFSNGNENDSHKADYFANLIWEMDCAGQLQCNSYNSMGVIFITTTNTSLIGWTLLEYLMLQVNYYLNKRSVTISKNRNLDYSHNIDYYASLIR
jgi:hypothetical protein